MFLEITVITIFIGNKWQQNKGVFMLNYYHIFKNELKFNKVI